MSTSHSPTVYSHRQARSDRERFQADGFFKFQDIIPPSLLAGLRQWVADQLHAPSDEYRAVGFQQGSAGQFAGYSNSMGLEAPVVQQLLALPALHTALDELCRRTLLASKTLGFVTDTSRRGLPWHFGFRSFNFIDTTDMGYTLWIPLDPIDVEGQHGGIAVVPESVYSGREESKLIGHLCHADGQSLDLDAAKRNFESFCDFRNLALEQARVEYSFEPGDALFFNRFVMHRSCAFREGALPHRRAIAVRFVCASARYAPTLMNRQRALFQRLGLGLHARASGSMFADLASGDRLRNSKNARPFGR